MTVVNIVKTILGPGLISYPVIFKVFGICPALVASLIGAYMIFITGTYLLNCKDITRKYGYAMYSRMSMGVFGTVSLKLNFILGLFGSCCFFLKLLGDLIPSIVTIFIKDEESIFLNSNFYKIVSAAILFPLIYFDDIQALNKTNFIGVLSTVLFCILMETLFVYKYFNGELVGFNRERLFYPKGSIFEIFACFTSIIEFYAVKHNFFPLYLSLKGRKTSKMNKAMVIGLLCSTFIYCLLGISCFIMFGENFTDILNKLRIEIRMAKIQKNYFPLGILLILVVNYTLTSLLSLPVAFFTVKKNTVNLIMFIHTKYKKKETGTEGKEMESKANNLIAQDKEEEGEEESSKKKVDQNDPNVVLGKFKKNLIITVMYFAVVLCSLMVESIIAISNALGSTLTNLVEVMLPCFFLIKFDLSGRVHVMPKMLFGVGVIIMLFFFGSEIYKIVAKFL
ncbi:MAG: amino acid transporter [archaeon]|nr:amino acid transporter [archaeon]